MDACWAERMKPQMLVWRSERKDEETKRSLHEEQQRQTTDVRDVGTVQSKEVS